MHLQTDRRWCVAALAQSPGGTRLAVWQAGLGALEWLDDLVKSGRAIDLGGNGYPCRHTATAEYLTPRIVDKPPGSLNAWISGASDILTEKWEGRTVVDGAAIAACRPDEWLLVEAWDES